MLAFALHISTPPWETATVHSFALPLVAAAGSGPQVIIRPPRMFLLSAYSASTVASNFHGYELPAPSLDQAPLPNPCRPSHPSPSTPPLTTPHITPPTRPLLGSLSRRRFLLTPAAARISPPPHLMDWILTPTPPLRQTPASVPPRRYPRVGLRRRRHLGIGCLVQRARFQCPAQVQNSRVSLAEAKSIIVVKGFACIGLHSAHHHLENGIAFRQITITAA